MALLDHGATGIFMDKRFARHTRLPIRVLSEATSVKALDGHEIHQASETLYETHPLNTEIGPTHDKICFSLIDSSYPIVIGLPWLRKYNVDVDFSDDQLVFPDGAKVALTLADSAKDTPIDIQVLSATQFAQEAVGQFLYAAVAFPGDRSPSPKSLGVLPNKYSEFADVFDKKTSDKLPPHRPYDHPIDLKPGAQPPFGPLYSLSPKELEALREYLDDYLAKHWIRPSSSPAGAPVLFFKKPDGSLRVAIDYRRLNDVTIKNRYPLPLIPELFDRIRQAKVFTKLDLRTGYNLVRIREGDEWKTAFRTRYGHFEYLVMPLGLTNAPATFQHFMNDIFRDALDHFVVIYLDDILIFSNNLKDHEQHVRLVLQRLRDNDLFCKIEKCSFEQTEVIFLGFHVGPHGLQMDTSKIQTILDWAVPTSIRDIQVFLGFANFYRRFIRNFASVVKPLTDLTRRTTTPFQWTPAADTSFKALQQAFTSAPILLHPDFDKQFEVETDASDFAIGAVLSQVSDSDNELHPVAFFSRKLAPAEINYDTGDKEALAIVEAFRTWRHYLEGAQHPTLVWTDHANLIYFTTTRQLTRRQARWAQVLADYDFELRPRPGTKNGKADALSRRPEYALSQSDPRSTENFRTLFPNPPSSDQQQQHALNSVFVSIDNSDFTSRIRRALVDDDLAQELLRQASLGPNDPQRRLDLPLWEGRDGLLLRNGLLYIPADHELRLEILRARHDSVSAGHVGTAKTYELITRDYWWPSIYKDVKRYVRTCETCARSKAPRHKPFGQLIPLPIPTRNWESISMDFITDLPPCEGYDSIMVIVDRLSKQAHFIPCMKTLTAPDTAKLYFREIYRHHGFPDSIISDRDPKFVSHFWRELHRRLGTKLRMSSTAHPQTDGQTENKNQFLEQYIRCFTSYQQDDWVDLLPTAEFALNSSQSASTGISPFYANYGFHPRADPLPQRVPGNVQAVDELIDHLEEIRRTLRLELEKAQADQARYANAHRLPAPLFKVGDKVWLLRRNIKTSRPSDKLDYARLGPYEIIQQINPVAFKLKLPATSQLHPVFHVSLLEPYYGDDDPVRHQPPPEPVIIKGHEEFVVNKILDSKFFRNQVKYLVDWLGYDPSERSWEPASNLKNAKAMVKEFHDMYPDKPRPGQRPPLRTQTRRDRGDRR